MSVATAFRHYRPFPFCVDTLPGGSADFIDNLTLADVMAFYWNTETLSISTSGTATIAAVTVDGTQTTELNPVSSTFYDEGSVHEGGWYPIFTTTTSFASWPLINVPRARVCHDGSSQSAIRVNMSRSGDAESFMSMTFSIAQDPVNAGKYRLWYLYIIHYTATDGVDFASIRWQNQNLPTGGMVAISTGTFSFAGLTFNYRSLKSFGASHTGGTMSASSTSYTY